MSHDAPAAGMTDGRFVFPRPPRAVLVVKKRGPGSEEVRRATGALVVWLIRRRGCAVFMERAEADGIAHDQHSLRHMRQTVSAASSPQASNSPHEHCQRSTPIPHSASSAAASSAALPAASSPSHLPAGLYSLSHPVPDSEVSLVDFCVTLGGDGTVLHLNCLLNCVTVAIPPLVSFAMGTLGFLTNLYFDEHQRILDRVLNAYRVEGEESLDDLSALKVALPTAQEDAAAAAAAAMVASPLPPTLGPASPSPSLPSSPSLSPSSPRIGESLMINPRMRLYCRVYRRTPVPKSGDKDSKPSPPSGPTDQCGTAGAKQNAYTFVGSYTCLNEVLVHRSSSPFLTSIDIELVEKHARHRKPFYVTTVQGDGLMASTPTGSTAYSMAAGGPLMAPNSPSMVLTPVSPHSLSFRPIILSAEAEVRFVIAKQSRIGITERMVDGVVANTPALPTNGGTAGGSNGGDGGSNGGSNMSAQSSSSPGARRWAAIASMDGHYQVLLAPGDFVQITCAPHPLRHLNLAFPRVSNEALWLQSLTHKLHWNLTGAQLRLLEEQSLRARGNGHSSHSSQQQHMPHHPQHQHRFTGSANDEEDDDGSDGNEPVPDNEDPFADEHRNNQRPGSRNRSPERDGTHKARL